MTKLLKFTCVLGLLSIATNFSQAYGKVVIRHRLPLKAKIVVVKPVRPIKMAMRPAYMDYGYVWIDGYWKWNRRAHRYVWVDGRIVKHRRNKAWFVGYWTRIHGGWFYVRGHWA